MKTIGLLGGMSWESTLSYYQSINQSIKTKLGGLHSAKIVLYSVDFAEIEFLQRTGKWEDAAELLADAAQAIEQAGADFFLICTNTMHKVASEIENAVSIPLLHIADTTAEDLQKRHVKVAGLLGTKFVMEEGFYKKRIKDQYGIDVLVPEPEDQGTVHKTIYEELCLGIIRDQARDSFLKIIERLSQQGAEAIILGCTEIGHLVRQSDTPIPLVDTASIHSEMAVELAIS